jgi:hypothetical protein
LTAGSPHKCLAFAAGICAATAQFHATALDNPLARTPSVVAGAPLDGRWNGANLERRSECTHPQNEGSRGTYAEFIVSTNTSGEIGITQNGITGLVCNYFGNQRISSGGVRSATGTYSCSDGKRGTFQTTAILVTDTALSLRMDSALEGSETCRIAAVIGGARLEP